MARKRTGTIQPIEGTNPRRYRARLRLADGSRPWFKVPEKFCYSEDRAREWAKAKQEEEDTRGVLIGAKRAAMGDGESPEAWAERWNAERVHRGIRSASTDEARVRDYVLPFFKAPTMASVTRDEIEDVRDALDAKIAGDELAWKTASNVWGLVTKMFDDAINGKRRDLRVRRDNPASGVHAPERGERKAKVYLYPTEALALLACDRVPLRWRRFFALTIYLYARPGEVKALTFEDIDEERGNVHIHKSIDRDTGEEKSTKTETSRRVPIEAELLPLLRAMREESGGVGRLVSWADTDKKLSRQIQRCLKLAGVKRADLFATDAARKQLTFYDLRATGITWCAVRGDEPLRIKQRAGHKSFSTTEGYIREAENLREGNSGQPFPPLPSSLVTAERSTERSTGGRSASSLAAITCGSMVEAPGIEF